MSVRGRSKEIEHDVTAEWIREVRAKLVGRGAQARLAEALHCSPGTITALLKPYTPGRRSHLVPKISKVLGVKMPALAMTRDTHEIVGLVEKMGDAGVALLRTAARLNPESLPSFIALMDQLVPKKSD